MKSIQIWKCVVKEVIASKIVILSFTNKITSFLVQIIKIWNWQSKESWNYRKNIASHTWTGSALCPQKTFKFISIKFIDSVIDDCLARKILMMMIFLSLFLPTIAFDEDESMASILSCASSRKIQKPSIASLMETAEVVSIWLS